MSEAGTAFGAYLKSLREAREWSLRDVGRRTGGAINFSWLARVEAGRTKNIGVRLVAALASAYGVSFADLCRRACPGAPE